MDDQAIILAIKQGDKEKFGLLYDKYIEKIYRFVYYKTFHRETAEDLTQKIFFKAFENIHSLKGKDINFSAWLYRIARNATIDHYRTHKTMLDISEMPNLSANTDIEAEVGQKHQLEQVVKYLDTLEPEQREIIVMRVWDGLSYREIAEIIGKNEASLKTAFCRALKKLRAEMPLELLLLLLANMIKLN